MPNPLASDLDHILDHTRDLWEDLRAGRIFITGGTGFFGCWLLESFLWANDELDLRCEAVVLTRDAARFRDKAPHLAYHPVVHLHAGDVRTFDFPAGSFSHVIHAATESASNLAARDPLEMLDTIVEGTRRALNFTVARGAAKFLLASSGAVYGKQPPEMTHVPETYAGAPDTMDPNSVYGEGKRLAELLCAVYHQRQGLEAKIARCFAFVGPYLPLDAHFAIGNFIRDAIEARPIVIKGDGTPQRSYLYAADLMIWLWTILVKGAPCRPYNVGGEESLSIAELARVAAGGLPVEVLGSPASGKLPERYVPSMARVQSELGLTAHIALPEAIRLTRDFHLRHTPLEVAL
jgi:nucleoside-diphosphate-sugar epimerase